MRRPADIEVEQNSMHTIFNLTSAFEGIASMHLAQTKSQVLQSQKFFNELWNIYTQIRVDSLFRFGRTDNESASDKELFIAITAEGGFSGDIDQKLIAWMLKNYDPEKHEIIIIGHHGALQLMQAGISFKRYFKLPARDDKINVGPLVREVRQYRKTSVFYQTYVSLMVQDIKRIELSTAVETAGAQTTQKTSKEVISESNYIFEPSTFVVAAHLERSMLEIALSQVILDSKLAQYASRFRAMRAANDRADKSLKELDSLYHRTKRAVADEQLKGIINGLRKAGVV